MANDDRHWQAFRYVAGEMTAAEEACFEERLADDQAVREAVEQAVALHEATRLAILESATSLSPRERPARRAALIWAASLAACVLLALGVWFAGWKKPAVPGEPGEIARHLEPEGNAVARAWVELRGQSESEGIEPQPPQSEALTASTLGAADMIETDISVPPWMLAAFSAQDQNH